MGELIHTFRNHTKDINCVAFSPNSKILASASGDKTVCLWNIEEGKEMKFSPLLGHQYAVTTCAFSPFGTIFATASSDQSIILWDIEKGEQIKTLQGHKGMIRCCCFSGNSQYLATGSSDETLRIWNIQTFELIRTLTGPEFSITTCGFTPDDLYVVSGSVYGDLRIWEIDSSKCEDMMQAHDSGVSGVGISGCSFCPTYGVVGGKWPGSQKRHHGESPIYLLATCGGDNFVKLWKVKTASAYSSNCKFKAKSVLEGHSGHVWDCKFSSNGELLVSCSSDKTVILWNPRSKTVITKLSGHSRYIMTVALSSDNCYLATGSNDKTVQVWALKQNESTNVSTNQDQAISLVSSEEPMKLLRSWSIEDVCVWLTLLGLSQYTESFRINCIDGIELSQIKDEILSSFLGVGPLGHRNKILRELKSIREKEMEGNIPDEFLCPITRELMSDPVIASDGFTYERSSITSWIRAGKDTSPMTNIPLQQTEFIPNRSLKSAIMRYFGPAPIDC